MVLVLNKQEIGSGMGKRPTPPFANIFMGTKIEPEIENIAELFRSMKTLSLEIFKRFFR